MKMAKTKERDIFLGKYWMEAGFTGTIETIYKALKSNIQVLNLHILATDSVCYDEAFAMWDILRNRPSTVKLNIHIHACLRNQMLLILLNADRLFLRPYCWFILDSLEEYCRKKDIDESTTPPNSCAYMTNHLSLLRVLSEHLPVKEILNKHIMIEDIKDYLTHDSEMIQMLSAVK
jgi:hypothetical protein